MISKRHFENSQPNLRSLTYPESHLRPNGAGKTTLFDVISGSDPADVSHGASMTCMIRKSRLHRCVDG